MKKNDLYCKHRRWKVCMAMTLTWTLSVFLVFSSFAKTSLDGEVGMKCNEQVADDERGVVMKGAVKDKQGNPLPGVTIVLKGTTVGSVTDGDGNFSFMVPKQENIVLVFNFIGMKPVEVKYTGQQTINVTMEEDAQDLDEVVVTGYASMRKESYTGSVTTIKGEELQKVANRNPIEAMQIFEPSFRIMENNEMGSNPNAIPNFYIRGQTAVDNFELTEVSETAIKSNPNLPIFILDGLETNVERIYDMDMTRIKSMTILKDAAATAIYGSRASNGVVVVETVAPMAGKFHVSYSLTGSITAPDLTSYDYMNAEEKLAAEIAAGYYTPGQYINHTHGSYTNGAERSVLSSLWGVQNLIAKGTNTDWMALPLRVGYNHKHSVNIDGGNENIRYGINLNYANTKGVMKGDFRKVLGATFRTDYRTQKLNVVNQVTYNKTLSKDSPYGSFSDYVKLMPYDAPFDSKGNPVSKLPVRGGQSVANPLYEATMVDNFSKGSGENIGENLNINYYPNEHLQVRGSFGIGKSTSEKTSFTDPTSSTQASFDINERGLMRITKTSSYNWSTNLEIVYNTVIAKENYLTATFGIEARETKDEGSIEIYRGFPNGSFVSPMFGNKIEDKPSYSESHSRASGLFGRFNFSHKDIYLFDASIRLDGSSEFGSDNKYAPFWALGTGINLHKYAFLEDNSWLTRLKFTFTFGQTGKMNFPAHAAKTLYSISLNEWYYGGIGMHLEALGNNDLKWELQDNYDFGLNFNLFENLLDVKLGYYYKLTKDMLTTVSVPSSFGFSSYYDNIGKVQNVGIEFSLTSHIIRKEDLFLSVYVNGAHNENKIKEISNSLRNYNKKIDDYYAAYDSNTTAGQNNLKKGGGEKSFTKYEEGGSTTSIFGMKSLGIDPSSGDEIFVRKDGSITTEWEAQEQQILGNSLPELQGAFGFNFQWKEWSMFVSFMYEFGGEALNTTMITQVESIDLLKYNADRRVLLDRWQEIGDVTPFKNIADRIYTTRPSSRFLQKNNNVTFNSLNIAYTKRDGWVKNLGLNQVKFAFTTNDIAYLSTIKRERGTSYPFARTFDFTLGVIF